MVDYYTQNNAKNQGGVTLFQRLITVCRFQGAEGAGV